MGDAQHRLYGVTLALTLALTLTLTLALTLALALALTYGGRDVVGLVNLGAGLV